MEILSGYFLTKRPRISKLVKVGRDLISTVSFPFSRCYDGLRAYMEVPSPLPSLYFSSQWLCCSDSRRPNRKKTETLRDGQKHQAKALSFLQQFSKAGLCKAKLWNSHSSRKMSYFSLAITPLHSPSTMEASFLIFSCFSYGIGTLTKSKTSWLAVTHNQLLPANASGGWWRDPQEEERRLLDELGLSQLCEDLVESLEDLRCDLGWLERGMIWGAPFAALVYLHRRYFVD